jgi:hypothetical protein
MSEAAQSGAGSTQGRVKWKRFAFIMVPAAAVAATLIGLTAQGAIGANISVSGQEYLVTASQLNGLGFEQFTAYDPQGKGSVPVAVTGIRSARITNLCQSVSVAGIHLVIRAGSAGRPVLASNLIVDVGAQSGDVIFHHIAIGQDAGTLTQVPGLIGAPGNFSEQAVAVTIKHLVQGTWLTTVGTFILPGLHLTVSTHGPSCP